MSSAPSVQRIAKNQALRVIRNMGLTARLRDGEFRINLKYGTEETAYYTVWADDAIETAKAMARMATLHEQAVLGRTNRPNQGVTQENNHE